MKRRNEDKEERKREAKKEKAKQRRKAAEDQKKQAQAGANFDRMNRQAAYRQQKKLEKLRYRQHHPGVVAKAAAGYAGHVAARQTKVNDQMEGAIENAVGKAFSAMGAEEEGARITSEGRNKQDNAKNHAQQAHDAASKQVLKAAKTATHYKLIATEAIDPTLAKNNQKKPEQFSPFGHHGNWF